MLDLDTEETDTRLWSKDKEVVLSLLPLPLLDRSLPESSSDASAVFVAVAVVAVVLWRDGASSSGTDTIRVLPVATGPFVLVDLLVGTMVLLCLRSSEAEGLLLLRLYVTLPELNELDIRSPPICTNSVGTYVPAEVLVAKRLTPFFTHTWW